MADGVAWKFAPLRVFPDRYELSLDNDCVLWRLPQAIRAWMEDGERDRCVLLEDVRPCIGSFAPFCSGKPCNGGMRGFPPAFDLERALRALLRQNPCMVASGLDERGLNVAALSRAVDPLVVRMGEVAICSPFPPHMRHLGSCGAHFTGINARHLPWSLNGRPAVDYIREHWQRHRDTLYERIRISDKAASAGASNAGLHRNITRRSPERTAHLGHNTIRQNSTRECDNGTM